MRAYRYHRVDVFTDRPLCGNPLAVFPTAQGLDAATMQALAREMNLSETTFVLPPQAKSAAARVRIFTIDRELPLAGHPVVGTAWALAATGGLPLRAGRNEVVFELGVGPTPVEIAVADGKPQTVFMTQRPPTIGAAFTDTAALARALSLRVDQFDLAALPARVVDTGLPWFLIPVQDLRALRQVRADVRACRELAQALGTDLWHAFTQDTGDPGCVARTRHVWWGTVTPGEDPVTGSAIGCIAASLVHAGVLLAAPDAEFAIEQGEDVGRPGKVTARVGTAGGRIVRVQVGGTAVHTGNGEIWLPD